MQIFFDLMVLILKISLFFFILSDRNTKVWSKEISMSPYVAKMFFVQVDEDFWLCWCVWYKNI